MYLCCKNIAINNYSKLLAKKTVFSDESANETAELYFLHFCRSWNTRRRRRLPFQLRTNLCRSCLTSLSWRRTTSPNSKISAHRWKSRLLDVHRQSCLSHIFAIMPQQWFI